MPEPIPPRKTDTYTGSGIDLRTLHTNTTSAGMPYGYVYLLSCVLRPEHKYVGSTLDSVEYQLARHRQHATSARPRGALHRLMAEVGPKHWRIEKLQRFYLPLDWAARQVLVEEWRVKEQAHIRVKRGRVSVVPVADRAERKRQYDRDYIRRKRAKLKAAVANEPGPEPGPHP